MSKDNIEHIALKACQKINELELLEDIIKTTEHRYVRAGAVCKFNQIVANSYEDNSKPECAQCGRHFPGKYVNLYHCVREEEDEQWKAVTTSPQYKEYLVTKTKEYFIDPDPKKIYYCNYHFIQKDFDFNFLDALFAVNHYTHTKIYKRRALFFMLSMPLFIPPYILLVKSGIMGNGTLLIVPIMLAILGTFFYWLCAFGITPDRPTNSFLKWDDVVKNEDEIINLDVKDGTRAADAARNVKPSNGYYITESRFEELSRS